MNQGGGVTATASLILSWCLLCRCVYFSFVLFSLLLIVVLIIFNIWHPFMFFALRLRYIYYYYYYSSSQNYCFSSLSKRIIFLINYILPSSFNLIVHYNQSKPIVPYNHSASYQLFVCGVLIHKLFLFIE